MKSSYQLNNWTVEHELNVEVMDMTEKEVEFFADAYFVDSERSKCIVEGEGANTCHVQDQLTKQENS